ncbi:hypothetical protein Bbelb_211340 [Branchiostoma belcheri]|nr:hypothetical protein Bbelb_211340 [Branchiostoma belcheri]
MCGASVDTTRQKGGRACGIFFCDRLRITNFRYTHSLLTERCCTGVRHMFHVRHHENSAARIQARGVVLAHYPNVFAMPARYQCAQCVRVRPVRTSAPSAYECVPVRPVRTRGIECELSQEHASLKSRNRQDT